MWQRLHGGPWAWEFQLNLKAVVRGHHFGHVASGVYAELSSTPGSTLQCYTMGMVERILGLFFFWWGTGHGACGILVPHPGIEPTSLALGTQCLNHWTSKKISKTLGFESGWHFPRYQKHFPKWQALTPACQKSDMLTPSSVWLTSGWVKWLSEYASVSVCLRPSHTLCFESCYKPYDTFLFFCFLSIYFSLIGDWFTVLVWFLSYNTMN